MRSVSGYPEDEHDFDLVVDAGLHQERLVAGVLGVPLHPRDVLVVAPLLAVVLLIILVVPHLPPHVADRSVRARALDAVAGADEEEAGKVPEAARWVRVRVRVREGSAGAVEVEVEVEVAGAGGRRRDGRCCGAVELEHQHHAVGEEG